MASSKNNIGDAHECKSLELIQIGYGSFARLVTYKYKPRRPSKRRAACGE